ncbi:MAG TPA: hypothetical protein VFQ25_06435 [Ktedonobacterales bacterium]|nr:hypothetical protein [Ktedonobacterales bacterium]
MGAPSRRRLGAVVAGFAALALLLAACGQSTAASGAGSPKLSCVTVISGHGIDVITAQLTCHVTGAAASDTSFSLQYRVTDDSGQSRTFSTPCAGALRDGAGSCAQSYTAPVPVPLTPATVSGYTSPGHQALGPVTPIEQDATLAPGQHL